MATSKIKIELQYADKNITQDELVERAKAACEADYGVKGVKDMQLYVKPEENKAYYVVNNKMTGSIDL
ncbi:DUF6465 family protein [Butyrivibrio sp. WCD3002]|uniref:DUF6465 family protein n=1 Tax=Butyrivibrio sp. WCD3002 TaxID=1280676 RepID=UPI00042686C6|nr:DUF6465 family protein [Butyrivibrio sp. WCD3002]